MPEIQAPDLGLAIRELLGIGEPNPLVTLSPEVVGVVKLADLTTVTPTGRRMAYAQNAPVVAGNYSFAWLGNGLNHGVTIERIEASANTRLSMYVYNSGAYPPSYVGVGLDGDLAVATLGSGADASAGVIGDEFAYLPNTAVWTTEIVLPPGRMIIVRDIVVADAVTVNWVWRE